MSVIRSQACLVRAVIRLRLEKVSDSLDTSRRTLDARDTEQH